MYRSEEVNGLGIFQGVCADQKVWVRMNVCCVRVLHRGWDEISWGAEGRILQWKCSIAMAGWGGGAFLVFVCEQPPNFFLPHWATDGCCFCGRVWSTTHTHTHILMQKHTPGGWMNGRPDYHTGPIDDIIAGHLVTPPFPCFREPFSQLQVHHGSFTDMTPIAYF